MTVGALLFLAISYIRETLIKFEVPIPVHLVSPKRVPEPTTARGTQT